VLRTTGTAALLAVVAKDGYTQAYPAKGRYGAWARDTVAKQGEFGGKKYDETRHYATLVVEFPK
jgi:hypothetical protein